ncbi:MAG TPA: ATP-binding protein, partial [Myxococcales bacterium]|nr:ATP-binding protein [Myxococcales bacterium]
NNVLEATLKLLTADTVPPSITVKRQLGKGLPKVTIDPEQLKQVLINLVLNAVQAMPKGGELTFTSALNREITGELKDATTLQRVHAVVRVHDTGEGIRPEDLPRVFLPFFTTRPTGTGLGLAVVRRIVEGHGGTITLGKPPVGAEFHLRLPLQGE